MARKPAPQEPDWSPEKTLPILKHQLSELQTFKGHRYQEVEQQENEWEQFTRNVFIHGFGEGSSNLRNFFTARSSGTYNMMGISDHQRQENFELRIAAYEATLKSSIKELEFTLPAVPETTYHREAEARYPIHQSLLILISHSSRDAEFASALIELMRLALGIRADQIRCSSVDGYRLPAGVQTDSQLRAEVNATRILIGLITPNSLRSPYVLFELGARWGAGEFMIPLLAGVSPDALRGPLSGINALSCSNEAQLHQLLEDIGRHLGLPVQSASSYSGHLSTLKTMSTQIS